MGGFQLIQQDLDERGFIQQYVESDVQVRMLNVEMPVTLIFPQVNLITSQHIESIKKFRASEFIQYCESEYRRKEFKKGIHEISTAEVESEIRLDCYQEQIMINLAKRFWPDDRLGNAYLRVSGFKVEDKERGETPYQSVTLKLSRTEWRFMKLREKVLRSAMEKDLDQDSLEFANSLNKEYVLNGLGVRVFCFSRDGYVLLQKKSRHNNTYPLATEASGCGYVDSNNPDHRKDGKLSLTKAAIAEVVEETGIAEDSLSFENAGFLGMTRNTQMGHLDIFMYWIIERDYKRIDIKGYSDRVESLQWWSVLPSVRNNLFQKMTADAGQNFVSWVPQAVVSLAIVLGYVLPIHHKGFSEHAKSGVGIKDWIKGGTQPTTSLA